MRGQPSGRSTRRGNLLSVGACHSGRAVDHRRLVRPALRMLAIVHQRGSTELTIARRPGDYCRTLLSYVVSFGFDTAWVTETLSACRNTTQSAAPCPL
jgi:hypothetical protein